MKFKLPDSEIWRTTYYDILLLEHPLIRNTLFHLFRIHESGRYYRIPISGNLEISITTVFLKKNLYSYLYNPDNTSTTLCTPPPCFQQLWRTSTTLETQGWRWAVTVEVLNIALFKFLLKVNVEIFKIVGVQEEKRGVKEEEALHPYSITYTFLNI